MRIRALVMMVGFGMVVLGLGVLASPALANNVDFFCGVAGPTACTGDVVGSGTTWSTSGLGFFQDAGPQPLNTPFTLTFNTGSSNQLTLTGPGSEVLTGVFDPSKFSAVAGNTTTTLTFAGVNWTTLPADFQSYLGSPTGTDNTFTTVFGTSCGSAPGCPNQSGDILITPVPEPSSISLFAFGLLLPGGGLALLRRRVKS